MHLKWSQLFHSAGNLHFTYLKMSILGISWMGWLSLCGVRFRAPYGGKWKSSSFLSFCLLNFLSFWLFVFLTFSLCGLWQWFYLNYGCFTFAGVLLCLQKFVTSCTHGPTNTEVLTGVCLMYKQSLFQQFIVVISVSAGNEEIRTKNNISSQLEGLQPNTGASYGYSHLDKRTDTSYSHLQPRGGENRWAVIKNIFGAMCMCIILRFNIISLLEAGLWTNGWTWWLR